MTGSEQLSEGAESFSKKSLAGREAELDQAVQRLTALRTGKSSVLAIRADSGLGKTRLVAEIMARAQALGMNVIPVACRGGLHGSSHPLVDLAKALLKVDTTLPPGQQFTQLAHYMAGLGAHDLIDVFSAFLGIHPTSAVVAMPDYPSADNEEIAENPTFDSPGKVDLPEAFARLIGYNAQQTQGLCISFDDLDEAGKTTITFVLDLIRRLGEAPVLLLATCGPSVPEELSAALEQNMITLSRLSREESHTLAAGLMNAQSLAAKFEEWLWQLTEGNPLFICIALERLQTMERLRQDDQGAIAADLDGIAISPTLAQTLSDVVEALPENQRLTLQCAAILDDGFRSGALSSLFGRDQEKETASSLEALQLAGWLQRSGEGRRAAYRFTHRIRRDVVYRSIPADTRTQLHNHAGDYYAVVSSGSKSRTQIAVYHYLTAGNPARAMSIIEIAISKAASSGTRAQIQSLYKLGMEAVAQSPELSSKQVELGERLGDFYAAHGDYAGAAEAYTEVPPGVVAPNILAKLGLVLMAVDPSRAVNVLSRALSVSHTIQSEDIRWILEGSIAWSLALSGNAYEAIRRSRDTLGTLGDTVGFGSARSAMRAMLGMILYYQGDPTEALPHLESARAGWGARNYQDGILLINQILIGLPKQEITRHWLKLTLPMLLPG